jgi:hypothetical protein
MPFEGRNDGPIQGVGRRQRDAPVKAQSGVEGEIARGDLGHQPLNPLRRGKVEEGRGRDQIDRSVERRFEVTGKIDGDRTNRDRGAGSLLHAREQAQIVIDEPPALAMG